MNLFYQYLENLLADHLKNRRVAVWYDPRIEFAPFVDSLPVQSEPENKITNVYIGGMDVSLARFEGSYFGLKSAIEPLVAEDLPGPVLLYLSGVFRDKKGSVLMELEKGGYCFEWKLKSQARFCLLKKYTDGVIDGMLSPENITYNDIVNFLEQSDTEKPSVLRMVFEGARENQAIIANFLTDPSCDPKIMKKGAAQELFQLIESRLGLSMEPGTPLSDARQKVLRFIMINEFRADLSCDPPAAVAMIPLTKTKEQLDLVRKTAQTDHAGQSCRSLCNAFRQCGP
jgi:hypothetical protein